MKIRRLSCCLVVVFLQGCWGGDDGSSPSVAPPAAPATDNSPPVITINDDNPLSVSYASNFIDPGATAQDDTDGSVVVVASGTVDTFVLGSYSITYSATDTAGNSATATRTVNVIDDKPPSITLASDTLFEIQVGDRCHSGGRF